MKIEICFNRIRHGHIQITKNGEPTRFILKATTCRNSGPWALYHPEMLGIRGPLKAIKQRAMASIRHGID